MLPSTGSDPFVHLHVASGYSLRHGASHPRVLVERAAEHGMDTLALTDRDGAYGVVKFAKACAAAGVRPVFGVDLAVAPVALDPPGRSTGAGSSSRGERSAPGPGRGGSGRSSPARGGAFLDQDPDRGIVALPRVVLLADVAPELGEWAAFFAAGARKRAAAEAGLPSAATEREADDLVREAETFLGVVEATLETSHQLLLRSG